MIAIFWVAGKAGAETISECASSPGWQPIKAIVGKFDRSLAFFTASSVNFAKLSASRVVGGDIALATKSPRGSSSSAHHSRRKSAT